MVPVGTAQMPSDGLVDAEGLRGYRLALAREARGYKRYPRQAEEAGWSGTAEVRVSVLEGGLAQEPRLLRSCGYAILDEAALEMLRRALPATPVPPVLRQRAFQIDLPVVFELPE
jgi:protein TonB